MIMYVQMLFWLIMIRHGNDNSDVLDTVLVDKDDVVNDDKITLIIIITKYDYAVDVLMLSDDSDVLDNIIDDNNDDHDD